MKSLPGKILISTVIFVTAGFAQVKPKILVIGDSISIGYFPFVKEALENKAEVFHNPGNAEHTGTGLENIEEWIGEGDWDIIQFNWGLWDLCYRHPDSKLYGNRDKVNGTLTYTVEEYSANLEAIVKILKAQTDAKLIFVTTTYVPENEGGRYEADPIRYNEAASKIMEKYSIEVNDIYEKSATIHQRLGLGDDDVHYTEKGYKKLSKSINKFLLKEIKEIN
ncbi:MAG: SGNH/GDSL hydrolase family protein [Bacteroidota bacterium]